MNGIDIASHQGWYNFNLAKQQGFDFAIIKASGGHGYQNPELAQQVRRAREAGMLVGFYHYMFEPSSGGGDVGREVKNFLDATKPYLQPGDTMWLDAEEWPQSVGYSGSIASFCLDFVGGVKRATGANCGIYTGSYYIQGTDMKYAAALADVPLWIASWQATRPALVYALPFKNITVWQYNAYDVVGGQQTDTDVFYGDADAWKALGVPADNTHATKVPIADTISEGLAKRGDGAGPINVTFANPQEPGWGIPVNLQVVVWNPDEKQFYRGEWDNGEWKHWVKL